MQIKRDAYAKINLGLDVTGRRDDGYHLVRMIMQNVNIFDTLTFEDTDDGKISLFSESGRVPLDETNLICRAARLLRDEFGVSKGVSVTLEKRIPVAAGMAGGSTDAAAAFLALNELWNLGLSRDELCKRGVMLGADIPYCIVGGTALSEGIGEVLTPIPDMPKCHLVVAKPDIDVSTAWAYRELDSRDIDDHPDIDGIKKAIEDGDLERMCSLIDNVLERVTRSGYDVIPELEKILEEAGAIRAFMTGSGPTVYAVYKDLEAARWGYRAVSESGLAPEVFLTEPINPNW